MAVAKSTKEDDEELHQALVQDLPSHVQEPCRCCSMKTLPMEYFAFCSLKILLEQVVYLVELLQEQDLVREEDRNHQSPATCPGGQGAGQPTRHPR